MFNLPSATEVNKLLPKKLIYAKFSMNTAQREKLDNDISRITIANEISPQRLSIVAGENIKSFFLIHIALKRKDFDPKNIIMISKLIPQNILFVLEYEDEVKLCVHHINLMQSEWMKKSDCTVKLDGLNLDTVWENIIISVGSISLQDDNTLDEQIAVNERRLKLQKEIDKLTRQAQKEKQPNKKFELMQKINKLKGEL